MEPNAVNNENQSTAGAPAPGVHSSTPLASVAISAVFIQALIMAAIRSSKDYFLVTTTTIATRLARICATDPAIAV